MTRALMIMGTGSDAGKSLIVAGLGRAFANRGLAVAPFKPQNMSNNAAVTSDGGEIGRAQALQARACRRPALTAMNPVLLKPEHDTGAQIIVRGRRIATLGAKQYFATRGTYLPQVLGAFRELAASADLVLIEGAGSASEVNLRANDIANFGFARAANVPVIVVGDISRGGVIASLAGTFAVIDPQDAELVVATLINRFHGDPALFDGGLKLIARHTGRPVFGPLPFFDKAHLLPAEDVLALEERGPQERERENSDLLVAVPRLGRIANFDDLDPLRAEPGVSVRIVPPGQALPRQAGLIIIPGTKAVRADLENLRANGWDIDIAAHIRAGGAVLGICGGYQMLGQTIADPDGIEGQPGISTGLGHLDIKTVLTPVKQLRAEDGVHLASGAPLAGYHMHMGQTTGPGCTRPFARFGAVNEGAVSANGRISGTYLHGLFASGRFRSRFLSALGAGSGTGIAYQAQIEATLDALAAHIEAHVDLDALLGLTRHVDG